MIKTASSIAPTFGRSATSHLGRIAMLGLMAGMAASLAGCGILRPAMNPSPETTSSIPDDYRTRHPITIAEVRHTLDVPVGSADSEMTTAMRDAVRGFAQNYSATSSATVQISVPQGALNDASARRARTEIRSVLVDAGISSTRIVDTSYPVSESKASHPVQLSYVAITAMTDECGNWPEDLTKNTENNRNWENFGCATQKNLAAQIANPMDLVAPRAMTSIDAQRRSEVIRVYRDGNTAVAPVN